MLDRDIPQYEITTPFRFHYSYSAEHFKSQFCGGGEQRLAAYDQFIRHWLLHLF